MADASDLAGRGNIGHGVLLQRADDSSPAGWGTIGQIFDLGFTINKDTVDVTNNLSPDRWRQMVSSLRSFTASGSMNLLPSATDGAAHKEMYDDIGLDVPAEYRIYFPSHACALRFDGIMSTVDHGIPLEDRMTLDFEIAGTEKPKLETVS